MQRTRRLIYQSIVCISLFSPFLKGDETDSTPKLRSTDAYRTEFQNSIFLRELVPQATTILPSISNFGKHWILEGILEDDAGEITVFIMDNRKNIIIVPSDELTILNHDISNDPLKTSITITNGRDRVLLKFKNSSSGQQVPHTAQKTSVILQKDKTPVSLQNPANAENSPTQKRKSKLVLSNPR